MKLIGKLKKQVDATTDKAQAKELIAKAGMELNDKELDQVSGGVQEEDDDFQLFLDPPPMAGHKDTCMMCMNDFFWYDPDPKPATCPFCDLPII